MVGLTPSVSLNALLIWQLRQNTIYCTKILGPILLVCFRETQYKWWIKKQILYSDNHLLWQSPPGPPQKVILMANKTNARNHCIQYWRLLKCWRRLKILFTIYSRRTAQSDSYNHFLKYYFLGISTTNSGFPL